MSHPVRQHVEISITEANEACKGLLHPKAEDGVRLFNLKEYWNAHEALEEAWLDESGPIRHLYKGILQAGVTYLHIERNNFIGAIKMYLRSTSWLAPWPGECRTLNIEQLRLDLDKVVNEAGNLGPDQLDKFDRSLLLPIQRVISLTRKNN